MDCKSEHDVLLAAAASLRKAADVLQAAGGKRNLGDMTGNIFNGILAKEQRIDFYLTVGFFLLALQTFIMLQGAEVHIRLL